LVHLARLNAGEVDRAAARRHELGAAIAVIGVAEGLAAEVQLISVAP
jgi:hypothetical protein